MGSLYVIKKFALLIFNSKTLFVFLIWLFFLLSAAKLVAVGYGIKKLQIMLTIVDDLVSVDTLIEEQLTQEPINEYVQSCDIVAFNKICKSILLSFAVFVYSIRAVPRLLINAIMPIDSCHFSHCRT